MKSIKYTVISLIVLSICASCITTAENNEPDILEIIYTVADKKGMRVISDLNMSGGDWYGKISADSLVTKTKKYVSAYHEQYGQHPSFWGWYLNNEINPIKVTETEKSVFWRKVWKSIVDECHRVRPGSMVTISPFFLLDKDELRGYEYLEPFEYEQWWSATLEETGIDILMLQDSGAEHLSFYTLAEREPFFAAFSRACESAGTKFWLNVETGQADVNDWSEALAMEKEKHRPKKWRVFTEINWLSQKLELASKYGESIVNWGYYPLMNPTEEVVGAYLNDVGGSPIDHKDRLEAYESYKTYYETVPNEIQPGRKTRPVMQGTLWYIPLNYSGLSRKQLEKVIEQQIEQQQAIGFDLLWLCNTPANMERALAQQRTDGVQYSQIK
ncbi:MAG TPA: DUF4434 domain-containing protein [Parapedobacter sp.]|uniref:DUF4434 domain-containing protein n=1 Tax=Parapedobacter sp. TaxID=1958893 RepID=UPI002BCFFE78|nr:DUF4434 domain-containing protein [Parapedobacter sp.]HWK57282.1 DUF4434 domain-containing protein [Parapedobacter sp.]